MSEPFERCQGKLVLRSLDKWHDHQSFLAHRHLLGQRAALTTRSGQRHHEGIIIAMMDDGEWVWSTALSRVRYEASSRRMNSYKIRDRTAPMVIVRVESTDGVPCAGCFPHYVRDASSLL